MEYREPNPHCEETTPCWTWMFYNFFLFRSVFLHLCMPLTSEVDGKSHIFGFKVAFCAHLSMHNLWPVNRELGSQHTVKWMCDEMLLYEFVTACMHSCMHYITLHFISLHHMTFHYMTLPYLTFIQHTHSTALSCYYIHVIIHIIPRDGLMPNSLIWISLGRNSI